MECNGKTIKCTEFSMKVPWGHISGKRWGSMNVRPILALHGWLDNAGTFDTLIPLLPADFSVLAVDMPGHGLSSHLPDGMAYHYIDYVSVVLRIIKEMKWGKVSILGHSMGSVVGLWFAGMFPDKIDFLIGIDTLKPPQIAKDRYWTEIGNLISNSFLAGERRRSAEEPPAYSYAECVERVHIGSESVERDKCTYLLTRNIKESGKYPGKYYFSRDARLKYLIRGIWPQDIYLNLASRIRIPYLYINALDAPLNEHSSNFNETISILQRNPLFVYEEVRGSHHVHLNNPENVSDIISNFLVRHTSESCKISKL